MTYIKLPNGSSYNIDELNSSELSNDFVNSLSELNKNLDKIYLSSDFHILREFIERDEDGNKYMVPFDESKIDKKRYDKMINMCERISDDDAFIYLGDLTESEFEENSPYIERVSQFYQTIFRKNTHNAPRILIRGNNDVLSKEVYKDFGFDFVLTKLELGNILFTHKPVSIDNDHVNIHGHIHESKSYYDISPKNHINVYFETNDGPQTIETFLNWYKSGKYSDAYLAFSDNYKTSDMIIDTGVNYE